MLSSGLCYACGKKLESSDFGRSDICPGCRRDTRVCRNCSHFAPGMNNDCREPQADRVLEKEKSNFCDYFVVGQGSLGSKGHNSQDLKAAADALFKKK